MIKREMFAVGLVALVISGSAVGCGGSDPPPPGRNTDSSSMFLKYGGKPTVIMIVNELVTMLLADPMVSPFFSTVDKAGHDSSIRLKSCLVLQFSAFMGDTASIYPGTSDNGDVCQDMKTVHAGLNINQSVFDQFILDLFGVLKSTRVSDADITTIVGGLMTMRTDIVAR